MTKRTSQRRHEHLHRRRSVRRRIGQRRARRSMCIADDLERASRRLNGIIEVQAPTKPASKRAAPRRQPAASNHGDGRVDRAHSPGSARQRANLLPAARSSPSTVAVAGVKPVGSCGKGGQQARYFLECPTFAGSPHLATRTTTSRHLRGRIGTHESGAAGDTSQPGSHPATSAAYSNATSTHASCSTEAASAPRRSSTTACRCRTGPVTRETSTTGSPPVNRVTTRSLRESRQQAGGRRGTSGSARMKLPSANAPHPGER